MPATGTLATKTPAAGLPAVETPAVALAAVAETRQLLYGWHAVEALLQRSPERILELWLREDRADRRGEALRRLADVAQLRIQAASTAQLDKLAGEVAHQGVVAHVRPQAAWDESQLLDLIEGLSRPPLLLVLDGITDPHNLGACLRSAEAAGVTAVVVPKDRAAGITPTVRRASSGAADRVAFFAVTNLARTLKALKESGVWLVGLAGESAQDLYKLDLKGPLAIVMGSEGEGMRRLTGEVCDFLAKIPMRGGVESLNVSVATGVALFEALRQRAS